MNFATITKATFAESKTAFHAGFNLAFKRMAYLMELITTMTNASDAEPKN